MASSRCVAIVQTNKKGVLEADPKAEANAAYIVRTCNAFPAVYESLRLIVGLLEHPGSFVEPYNLKAAHEALAAGGGETK